MKKNRGITLVALVFTIIILVILASISISFVLKQDGIFKQAKQAQELSKIGEYKERIDLILSEEVLKANLENKQITITGLIERFERESFIGSVERIDVEEIEIKGTIRLITADGYRYEVILDGEELYSVSQGKEDGEPYPTITLEQLPMQGIENERIQIKVIGEVAKGKETTEIAYVERMDTKEKQDYVQEGLIFVVEGNGTYTFSVTTNKGKSRLGKITINVAQPKDTISITVSPTMVTNKDVEVTIKYGKTEFINSDKYQYKIGLEGNWKIASTNELITKVEENEVVVVRYYDGKNSFKVQNYNIQNIDKVQPNNFSYTTTKTTNSITMTGTTTDTGSVGISSGNIGIAKYEYSKDNGVTWQVSNIFEGLTTGTYTVKMRATDKAGNVTNATSYNTKIETESIIIGITKLQLDKTSMNLKSENTVKLNPVIEPIDCKDVEYKWTSSNLGVTTVNNEGNVMGIATGSSTITCTEVNSNLSATCIITIAPPLTIYSGGSLNSAYSSYNRNIYNGSRRDCRI